MRLKVKGLVLGERPKGETSKLLTVLTDICGVITVNAKGVRKISAAYLKSAQLFAFSEMLLYEKNGFYTLVEASLVTDFYPIREDLNSYALACYICESAGAFAPPGEDSSGILRLALNTLYAIENKTYPLKQIKAAFEFRICAESGFAPDAGACAVCGREIGGDAYFDLKEGEVYCGDCKSGTSVLIGDPVRRAISHIICSDIKKFASFRIPESDLPRLSDCAERFFLAHAERGFNTLAFYKNCEELK